MPKTKNTKAKRGNLWRVHPLISDEQRNFLTAQQKETGKSHSSIIRIALDQYIAKINKKKK